MTNWPDGWQRQALETASIPVTDFAIQVLTLWAQATPTDRWTNNPLGIPAFGYATQRAFSSQYAAFPTMTAFAAAFKQAAHAKAGAPLYTALAAQDSLTAAWRAIHGLEWPANGTETDYPATILDVVDQAARDAMGAKQASQRKTVGLADTRTNVHATIATHGNQIFQSAANVNSASRALNSNLGRVNRRGG